VNKIIKDSVNSQDRKKSGALNKICFLGRVGVIHMCVRLIKEFLVEDLSTYNLPGLA
jgi:hypothetical protein